MKEISAFFLLLEPREERGSCHGWGVHTPEAWLDTRCAPFIKQLTKQMHIILVDTCACVSVLARKTQFVVLRGIADKHRPVLPLRRSLLSVVVDAGVTSLVRCISFPSLSIFLRNLQDPIYVEAFLQVNQFDLVVEMLLINRTHETLQNVTVELSTHGTFESSTRKKLQPEECWRR